MLKKRLTAILVIRDGVVVQSIGFSKYLPVGKSQIAVEFLNSWGIDEIIYLDISATPKNRGPDFLEIQSVSKKCFVPLVVGGGISSVGDMLKLVKFGADKIAVNSAVLKDPLLIKKGATILGNQCIVASIDVKLGKSKEYSVFSNFGIKVPEKNPLKWAKTLADLGAGEILLNCIDRDGSKAGYDINIVRMMAEAVDIPIIACGGAGHPQDFVDVMTQGRASCAAAGNFFHFAEHNAITAKAYLRKMGVDIRFDTQAHYEDFEFDKLGRVAKKPDKYLAEQRFKYYPPEVI